ncbi:MAG TPA: transcription termination factor Rho [Pseudonocardiaceae bacterium]|nr:transcription termination factor Rho [Pseudonocardiaceae bacterium]
MTNTDLLSSEAAQAASPIASSGSDATSTNGSNGTARRKAAGLSGMVLPELRELAGQLGITGITGMRKGDLIAAIKERQGASSARSNGRAASRGDQTELPVSNSAPAEAKPEANGHAQAPAQESRDAEDGAAGPTRTRRRRSASRPAGSPEEATGQRQQGEQSNSGGTNGATATTGGNTGQAQGERRERTQGDQRQGNQRNAGERPQGDRPQGDRPQGDRPQNNRQGNNAIDDDDERGGRRGRRFRDRRRRGGQGEGGGSGGGGGRERERGSASPDTEIREDDVLLSVGGILDVLENYAFVRTSGYLSGPSDVYVSLSLVRKYGLRRGDAITGAVRQPRDGEQQRQKFNPLVRVDSINGMDPEAARNRPEFTKLTPLYPNERLRLETEPHVLTTRVIDLVMPIGKGQRALVVSPPKAGKTMVLQSIANAITTNNPECHLMVVLVDERPEEVTDMQRSVKGEVIASTFDRPPSDHTTVAELSIERAKRLVEMGHDVVVLLDSITRLGRAYNLAAPASGRILSGGVDSTALYPPKRFLGAARNIENGGSLTIFATALVETGSTMDTVIFEEFKGTGNAELKLDRKIADKRVFPAVDVDQSSTRKEELLLSPDELAVTHKLRRVLHALDTQQAIDLLLQQLRKTRTNIEFLMQVAKTTPGSNGNDD